ERTEQARVDGVEPLPEGMQSTGGMPTRVKCLHALVAHELAVPGANPFGAEALAELGPWWDKGPCVCVRSEEHTSELQSRFDLVCRLLLEKKNKDTILQ